MGRLGLVETDAPLWADPEGYFASSDPRKEYAKESAREIVYRAFFYKSIIIDWANIPSHPYLCLVILHSWLMCILN